MSLNPFNALGAKVFGGAAVLLALACAFLWLRLDAAEERAVRWQTAFNAQKRAYVLAQRAAELEAQAVKTATENRYATLARRADDAQDDVHRAAADRFALSRRLRGGSGAACGPPGETAAPARDGAPADRDGPGEAPVDDRAVVLTRPEYDEFVANSLRLDRVRRWGESLITAGLAVPEAGFGEAPVNPQP